VLVQAGTAPERSRKRVRAIVLLLCDVVRSKIHTRCVVVLANHRAYGHLAHMLRVMRELDPEEYAKVEASMRETLQPLKFNIAQVPDVYKSGLLGDDV